MNCNSCKEPISLKLRYALAQNVCPFCGEGILSKADFVFRKAIAGILKSHGITDGQKAFDIISDIERLIGGEDSEPEAATEEVKSVATSAEAVEPVDLDDEDAEATPEEKAEVEKMISSGEIAMAGVMTKGPKKKGAKVKYVPKPIALHGS